VQCASTQFKNGMLTMMEINSSALQLRELNILSLYDVLREEGLVIGKKLLVRIESTSPQIKRRLNISNPLWCCLLFFRRPSQPVNDQLSPTFYFRVNKSIRLEIDEEHRWTKLSFETRNATNTLAYLEAQYFSGGW